MDANTLRLLGMGRRRPGLTLVEMLVVLVILAVVTMIAVQSTEYMVDQGRYAATQQTLQNVQNAIVGSNQVGPNGSLLVTGFVADMGRLPQLTTSGGDPLRELWDQTVIPPSSAYGPQTTGPLTNYASSTAGSLTYAASSTYNTTTAPVKVTTTMACGWRGPYLQLPPGSGGLLLDGWGKPFDSMSQSSLPSYSLANAYGNAPNGFLVAGQQINIVRSLGADNQADPVPLSAGFSAYNIDQYVPSQLSAPPTPPTATTPLTTFSASGSVSVVVQCFNVTASGTFLSDPLPVGTNDAVEIVLFAPVNGVLTPAYGTNAAPLPGAANANYFALSATTGKATPNVTATFTNVPIGPRALQAFQFDVTTGNVSKRSPLVTIVMPSGGLPTQTLILQ